MRRRDEANVIPNYSAIWVICLRGRSSIQLDINSPDQPKSRVERSEAMAESARPTKQVDYAVSALGFCVDE
jgi:hypothetical protein